jgi:hypothetical protein
VCSGTKGDILIWWRDNWAISDRHRHILRKSGDTFVETSTLSRSKWLK